MKAGEPMIIENVQVDLRYQEFGSNEAQGSGFCFLGVFSITCKIRTMGGPSQKLYKGNIQKNHHALSDNRKQQLTLNA